MKVTDKAYQGHSVFGVLQRFMVFYEKLAESVFSFSSVGTTAFCSIDTYVYSSMQGTLESMRTIMLAGRINDAYALLRKYHDCAIINIYTNVYLSEYFNRDKIIDSYRHGRGKKVNNWLHGKEKIPSFKVMSEYIKLAEIFKPIHVLLAEDNIYENIRSRCNNHVHYNFYRQAMLNNSEVYVKDRPQVLDQFSEDVQGIFVLNMGYTFFLNDCYMRDREYLDCLECGMQSEDGLQYLVAPFIQEIFDNTITPRRPEITAAIKLHSAMRLT